MSFEYRQQDRDILATMAEYRVLPVRHLMLLHRRNSRALRRRLRLLRDEGLIRTSAGGLGTGRGRPEQVLSLTPAGVDRLKADGILAAEVQSEQVTLQGLGCVEHQLLLNEFRLQLTMVPRAVPGLAVHIVGHSLPHGGRHVHGMASECERVSAEGDRAEHRIEFSPDEVFSIEDTESRKAVLFFLEVDMGSESLISHKRMGKDVRQKVANYQACFRGQHYRCYERLGGFSLRGFRLLFLANSVPRTTALCRLVERTPSTGFIWLTDRASMLSKGVWAPIWIRGGRHDGPLHSILGSRTPSPCPRPSDLS